jgi:hypothetical protein
MVYPFDCRIARAFCRGIANAINVAGARQDSDHATLKADEPTTGLKHQYVRDEDADHLGQLACRASSRCDVARCAPVLIA